MRADAEETNSMPNIVVLQSTCISQYDLDFFSCNYLELDGQS